MPSLTVTTSPTATKATELDRCLDSLASGSTDALAELYSHVSRSVYSFALSIVKNRQDAEDALHDCMVSVYTAAGSYRSSGKPMAWILTITRNLCLAKLRERSRASDIPEEDWEKHLVSNDSVSPEDRLVLAHCMTLLADDERQIVVLHAVSGFKHREIAEIVKLPLATVLSKYHRALGKLRNVMESGGDRLG